MSGKADFDLRRKRLIKKLDGATLLVSNLVNVRYLTGFTGSNAFFIVNDSGSVLLSDGRYTAQLEAECPDLEYLIRPVDSTMLKLVATAIDDLSVSEIQIESDAITRGFWRDLDTELSSTKIVDSTGIVESLRAVKDDFEISQIRKSIEINESAFEATLANFDRSWSEQEFAWHLEREIRSRGGSGFSFDPIVASGNCSALPHYHAGKTKIADDALLLVDWGTAYDGYASDLTRVISTTSVSAEIGRIHHIVRDAKEAACATIKDGVDLKVVDSAARKLIAEAGFEEHFNHGLGHGFGLEIHESPFISPAFEGTLAEGMVITIEPGIYLPGIGGVRLEDDILVTSTGFERLNRLPDDFFAV